MLNFNVEPYYDDFDPSKNFHRILYKPGAAVQARELTQSQTILQSQISKFADHIFSQNTPVTGGNITVNQNCFFLKLNKQYNEVDVIAANFLNKIITNGTGNVIAKVIQTEEATGTDVELGDPPTLIVNYLSGGHFKDADTLYCVDGTNINATIIGTAGGTTGVGKSSVASISDGVFYVVTGYSESSVANQDGTYSKYHIGNFVSVQPQTTILNKYSSRASARVGLMVTETIVDYIDDASLLDPAVGASNYQAPGADRLLITLTLTTLPLQLGNDDKFIELLRIEKGVVQKQVDSTVYSVIDDYFAKRTAETNGDFIVNNFKIVPSANTIDANTYLLNVGPGVAYVQGYRVENQSTLRITSNRSRATSTVNNNSNYLDLGNFVYVDNVKGQSGSFFDISTGSPVDFHVVGPTGINRANTTAYNATLAGTAYIRSLTYQQASNTSNSQTYIYKAHIFDVSSKVLSSNVSSSNATHTIINAASAGQLSNVANAYIGCTITIDSGTSAGDSRTITQYDPGNKTIRVDTPFTFSPDSTSNFSIRFGIKDFESMVNANTTLDLLGSASLSNYGKDNNSPSGYTHLFNTSNPELIFPLGNDYVAAVTDSSYTTTQQFRAQSFGAYSTGSRRYLQLDPSGTSTFDFIKTAAGATEEGIDAVLQNWVVVVTDKLSNTLIENGDIVDFTTAGRSITVDTNKNGVYLTALDLSPFTATIYARLSVTNASDTNLILRTKTLVEANTTYASSAGVSGVVNDTYVDLTAGQIWIPEEGVLGYGAQQKLYVSDVKRIVKIVDTDNQTPNVALLTTGTDRTTDYVFNNGQTDSYYGHAYITLKPGRPKPKSLWILFDFYQHSGGDGYFSSQSYGNVGFAERPTYKASNGITYNLKDCLDFRPALQNVQPVFSFKFKVAPTVSNNSGLFLPSDVTPFNCDYSYYLGRKDLLIISRDKTIRLIEGTPGINPIPPAQPEGSLLLANITLDPYTEYVPGQAQGKPSNVSIQPVNHKRWAFKDITDLQERVNDLQYYASLNLLEQKASSLQIQDSNGLNRFKNGILVDDFSTFAIADSFNIDFSAGIDTRYKTMGPSLLINNYPLQNEQLLGVNFKSLSTSALNSLSFKASHTNSNPLYTLPYTEEAVVVQPLASRPINANPFSVVNSTGVLTISPTMDSWIDKTSQPELLFIDPNIKLYNPSSTQNLLEGNPTLSVGDWQTIPGTERTVLFEEGNYNVSQTFANKTNTYSQGYWSQTYNYEGSFIKNISLLPYIRSQQINFRATDMLFNATVNAWFDGKRVSRMIRKPNILELTDVTGTFNVGDVIGYVSSSIFHRTGVVSDVYTYNNENIRLYVIDDQNTTTYGATVVSARTNTSGVYQSSGATGTLSSSTHYSGKAAATTSGTSTVTLDTKANSTDIYTGLEFWVINGSASSVLSIPKGQNAIITSYNPSTKEITLDKNVSISAGETYSIGSLQTNEAGNISGVFNLPGGIFNTGTRIFRIDNRLVTQGANDFYYNNGTETTFAEASFFAQGLTTQSQQLNFSASLSGYRNVTTTTQSQEALISETRSLKYVPPEPPIEVPGNPPVIVVPEPEPEPPAVEPDPVVEPPPPPAGGGGGCCVVATALTEKGIWKQDQKDVLIAWCEKYLHDRILGECFRRGYQVVGSKIVVPALRSESKWFNKYANWAWTNGTNMVMGKKFNPLSIPNSLVWITVFMAVGAVATKKYATKCWKKLYK